MTLKYPHIYSIITHAFNNNYIHTLIPSTKLETCSSFHLVLKTPIRKSLPSSSPKLTSDSAARSAVTTDDVEEDWSSAGLWLVLWVEKAVVLLSRRAVRTVRNIILVVFVC